MDRLLIAIDMQNDFITGSLGTKEAQSIVPCVSALIERANREGWGVILTRDTHHEDYMDTLEGQKLPVPHCIEGTPGHALADGIVSALKPTCVTVDKPTFMSRQLYDIVNMLGDDDCDIVMCGLCTDICVVSNALYLRGMMPDRRIYAVASCCAGTTIEAHEAALAVMRSCQIDVVPDMRSL